MGRDLQGRRGQDKRSVVYIIHTYIHTNVHTYTYMHAYIHTYIHTYIFTYIIICKYANLAATRWSCSPGARMPVH